MGKLEKTLRNTDPWTIIFGLFTTGAFVHKAMPDMAIYPMSFFSPSAGTPISIGILLMMAAIGTVGAIAMTGGLGAIPSAFAWGLALLLFFGGGLTSVGVLVEQATTLPGLILLGLLTIIAYNFTTNFNIGVSTR